MFLCLCWHVVDVHSLGQEHHQSSTTEPASILADAPKERLKTLLYIIQLLPQSAFVALKV